MRTEKLVQAIPGRYEDGTDVTIAVYQQYAVDDTLTHGRVETPTLRRLSTERGEPVSVNQAGEYVTLSGRKIIVSSTT